MIPAPSLFDLVGFVAIAFFGRSTYRLLRDGYERLFSGDRYARRQAARKLEALISDHEGLPGHEAELLEALTDALGFDRAELYRLDPDRKELQWQVSTRHSPAPDCRSVPVGTFTAEAVKVAGFTEHLALHGQTQTVGYLLLGKRPGAQALTHAEQMLIAQVCGLLALGLENQWLGRTFIDQQLATRKAEEERALHERLNAVVAHQLKTPLQLSQSMLQDARESIEDRQRVAKRLDKIRSALARFERNVMIQIDRSELAGDRFELQVVPVALRSIVHASLEEARYAARKRGARLEGDVPADFLVLADAARLEIVFDNLISNALKVLSSGGRLRITADRAGDRVWIVVTDTGPGIPPERLEKLFEVQPPNPHDPTSTGVGLSICREYMHAMGGTIDYLRDRPHGAAFRLMLPSANKNAARSDAGGAERLEV